MATYKQVTDKEWLLSMRPDTSKLHQEDFRRLVNYAISNLGLSQEDAREYSFREISKRLGW